MISVVIPIHNEEEMLSKYATRLYPAIDYYKKQFSEEVEVVLVDDGSTDDTAAVAEEFVGYQQGYQSLIKVSLNISFSSGL